MLYQQIVGYSGTVLQIVGMSSQLRHSYLTKGYRALSPVRIMTDITTNGLTLAYGILLRDVPISLSAASVVVSNVLLGLGYIMSSTSSSELDSSGGSTASTYVEDV